MVAKANDCGVLPRQIECTNSILIGVGIVSWSRYGSPAATIRRCGRVADYSDEQTGARSGMVCAIYSSTPSTPTGSIFCHGP